MTPSSSRLMIQLGMIYTSFRTVTVKKPAQNRSSNQAQSKPAVGCGEAAGKAFNQHLLHNNKKADHSLIRSATQPFRQAPTEIPTLECCSIITPSSSSSLPNPRTGFGPGLGGSHSAFTNKITNFWARPASCARSARRPCVWSARCPVLPSPGCAVRLPATFDWAPR